MTTNTMDTATAHRGWRAVETTGESGHRERLVKKLYDHHVPALQGYVTALLEGDRQGAEDVVQETVLRAWRHADNLDENAESFRPWLFKVARRLVIDKHRTRKARPKEIGGVELEWLPQADDSDRKLSSIVVGDALGSLSQPHREVLAEVYFRGSGVDEASRYLGIPPGTVKSRTYYAMRALRVALQERGLTGRE